MESRQGGTFASEREQVSFHKTPPSNIEMEQAVIGAILLDNDALPKALEVLQSADQFYRPVHRHIWEAILELYEKNEPVDIMTVSETLKRRQVEGIGVEYLAELMESTPTAANIRVHARIVREKSVLRKLITTAGEVVQLAYENSEDVDFLLDQVETMVFDVAQNRVTKTLAAIRDVVKESMKTIENLYNSKQLVTGAPTGFGKLDEMTSGLHPSDLVIVAGRPSMGKTAFTMNVAQNLTRDREGAVVAVFSLEMSAEQLVLRMLCSEARVSGGRIRTGYLAQSDFPKLTSAAGRLHASKIFIDDSAGATVLDIRAKCRRLKAEQKRLDLVVIDYLQLMSGRGKVESRVLEISEITRSLKQSAKELGTPVIALSQLSRKVEERTDRRPQLADLRESGSIEQDADLVLFVYREEFYQRDNPELTNKAEIIIGKQRNGPLGTVRLAFLKDFTRFENLSMDEPMEGPTGDAEAF